LIGWLSKV